MLLLHAFVPTRGPVEPPSCSGRRHSHRPCRFRVLRAKPDDAEFSIESVFTYDERQEKLYPAKPSTSREDGDDESLAALIPGGLVRDRPDQRGAETAIRKIEEARPLRINIDLAVYQGRRLRQKGQKLQEGQGREAAMKDAEKAFKRALELDPTDPRAYVSLGTLYVRQHRLEDARRVFDEGCMVTEGKNQYLWTALANLERKVGNIRRARSCFDAALVISKKHAAAWHGWGMLEREEGNFAAARDLFSRGIQATSDDPSPFLFEAMGNLAGELDLVREARYWYRQGTNTPLGAKSHALYVSWALLEWRKGDPAVVRYLFEMALQQSPRNRYALLSFAMFEKECGQIEACRTLLDRGLEINPTDPALYQAYGVLCSEEGNFAHARTLFERGVAADRRHQPLWQAWGIAEWRAGNIARARELFQQGVWADPNSRNNVYLWQAWGVMEGKLGNAPTARILFKAGLKADPDNEACWQAWTDMEEANGLFESADQLRNYRNAARSRIALPSNFSTLPTPTNPIVNTILDWVSVFDRSLAERRQMQQAPEEDALAGIPRVEEDTARLDAAATSSSRQREAPRASSSAPERTADQTPQVVRRRSGSTEPRESRGDSIGRAASEAEREASVHDTGQNDLRTISARTDSTEDAVGGDHATGH